MPFSSGALCWNEGRPSSANPTLVALQCMQVAFCEMMCLSTPTFATSESLQSPYASAGSQASSLGQPAEIPKALNL